jgi:hypothetical protein
MIRLEFVRIILKINTQKEEVIMALFKRRQLSQEEIEAQAKRYRDESNANGLAALAGFLLVCACWYFLTHSGENVKPGGRYNNDYKVEVRYYSGQ